MVKLIWLKSYKGSNIGGIFESSKKSAENFVSQGYAEYFDEPKSKIKVFADKTNVNSLIKKFPNCEKEILTFIEEKCEYYSTKTSEELEKYGFEEGQKNEYCPKIAESILLVENNYQKPKNEIKKPKNEIENRELGLLSRRGTIESFWKKQPFYYDKSKIFWLWNKKTYCWEKSDEIDYLNLIQELLGEETINSKARVELIEGFRQIGRKNKPLEMEKSWVQFKDVIYDIKNNKSFKASYKYFTTNAIPYKIGKSEETPTIDSFFNDWVGEENKQILYEFLAYNLSQDKFMQRVFAFCGGGSNGKGTFIKLNYKFLGDENCVASEIKSLSENRFEVARLYKKLLCVMGEVAYDDLKNTNTLKKLAGEDKLSFEFKGKDGFTDDNTSTCVCLTNSLPKTPDKSIGFYRKWLIVDFPNQFSKMESGLIDNIPEIEFENLAKKCLRILKRLYKNPIFFNEGNFDERMERYEERSNPVMRFIESYCDEEPNEKMILRDFTNLCNDYLKKMSLRVLSSSQIGRILRDEGFIVGSRKIEGGSAVVILNIKYCGFKNGLNCEKKHKIKYFNSENNVNCEKKHTKSGDLPLLPLKPSNFELVSHREMSWKVNGINGNNGNFAQKPPKNPQKPPKNTLFSEKSTKLNEKKTQKITKNRQKTPKNEDFDKNEEILKMYDEYGLLDEANKVLSLKRGVVKK